MSFRYWSLEPPSPSSKLYWPVRASLAACERRKLSKIIYFIVGLIYWKVIKRNYKVGSHQRILNEMFLALTLLIDTVKSVPAKLYPPPPL